jgi:hypothetical protein
MSPIASQARATHPHVGHGSVRSKPPIRIPSAGSSTVLDRAVAGLWSPGYAISLTVAAVERYTPRSALRRLRTLGPDRSPQKEVLWKSIVRRASTVFENSTACASTIDSRSWCASRFDPSTGALRAFTEAVQESSREVPRHGSGPRCIGPGRLVVTQVRASNSMTAFREVLHGEFDPGSGRTLAACLTHASGATNQGLPWGRAANG